MQMFTVVLPTVQDLPPELGLLYAPVLVAEPSAPNAWAGHTQGVLLDDKGRVAAFIVRLSPRLAPGGPRALVAASAVSVTDDAVIHLAWTESQLAAQPRLDEDLQPHERVEGGAPIESQWMPARPNPIPPESGVNGAQALRETVEGSAIGAVVGAGAGLVVGGPIGALALGAFFAGGGALAGFLSGVTQETAVEAGEMRFDDIEPEKERYGVDAIRRLEEALRSPAIGLSGLIRGHRLSPLTSAAEPPAPSPGGARMVGMH